MAHRPQHVETRVLLVVCKLLCREQDTTELALVAPAVHLLHMFLQSCIACEDARARGAMQVLILLGEQLYLLMASAAFHLQTTIQSNN